MRPPLKFTTLALTLFAWIAAGAAPARAASQTVVIQASVIKPLTLTLLQNFDLGSVVLGPGLWSNATVTLTRNGQFTCTNVNLTCSGAVQRAMYNVTGTNGERVRISAPNVTLVNTGDPGQTLTLVVDAPATVTLPNSGAKGMDFPIGGSITLNSTTPGGTYSGTFNVTVDY